MHQIPLIKPYITDEVKKAVCDVLDSGYLTEGPVTRDFEGVCREYIGCSHAIAVSNCTVGLEMALRALGVGLGDEVIVPDYTYPATASVVNIVGATVVLVDVDPDTMLIDMASLEAALTPLTKVVMPVSIFGNPLDYDQLDSLKQKHGFYIIEDAACSIGATYRGRQTGTLADISVFSLHPRKFITTGEGGLVTTNNADWGKWMDSYKHFGMSTATAREGIVFDMIGTNYKLSNIQSAIGLVQMRHIDELLSRRRQLAKRYRSLLGEDSRIDLPGIVDGGDPSWQSCCVFVEARDRIMQEMRGKGIEVQIGTYSLHQHSGYAEGGRCRWSGKFTGSLKAFAHTLTLPLYNDLSEADQDRVIRELTMSLNADG